MARAANPPCACEEVVCPPVNGGTRIVYVDATNRNCNNQGRSRADAVNTLQRVLSIARNCSRINEIRVAKRTYTPSATATTQAARDFSFVAERNFKI